MTRWLAGIVSVLILGQTMSPWQVHDPVETGGVRLVVKSAGLLLERSTPLGRLLVRDTSGALVADGDLSHVVEAPPGRYQLRVVPTAVIAAAPATIENVELVAGEIAQLVLELPVGELTIDARARGQVVAQMFAGTGSERPIATLLAGRPVLVAAGQYDLRVAHIVATEEVAVRWIREVVIEPGRHTAPRIEFIDTQILVNGFASGRRLTREEGMVAVFRAGDVMRERVVEGTVAERLLVEPGRYDIEVTLTAAADRPVKTFTGMQLADAKVHELEARFETSLLLAKADLGGLDPLADYDAYLYVYRPGEHEAPLAYLPTGHAVMLSAGRYDLRAFLRRSVHQPSRWVRDVRLAPGETHVETAQFNAGRLLVHVLDARGEELIGDAARVWAYEGASSARALAHWRAGEMVTIGAGRYAFKVTESVDGATHSFTATVSPGQLTERTIRLTPAGP